MKIMEILRRMHISQKHMSDDRQRKDNISKSHHAYTWWLYMQDDSLLLLQKSGRSETSEHADFSVAD